jgi:hypothetical protein
VTIYSRRCCILMYTLSTLTHSAIILVFIFWLVLHCLISIPPQITVSIKFDFNQHVYLQIAITLQIDYLSTNNVATIQEIFNMNIQCFSCCINDSCVVIDGWQLVIYCDWVVFTCKFDFIVGVVYFNLLILW